MAIPSVNLAVNSGGLGIIQQGLGTYPPNIAGWCSSGTPSLPTTFGQGATAALQSAFGTGPAVDLACSVLANGSSSVVITRIYSGTIGAATHTGTGTATLVQSGNPVAPYGTATSTGSTGVLIKIVAGGAPGTATMAISLDGGNTYGATVTTPLSTIGYLLTGTGVTLTFTGAGTGAFVTGDTYVAPITSAVGSSGTVKQLGPNASAAQGTGTISADASNNPIDAFNVIVLIVATGTVGVGQYSVSIDGGITFGNNTLIPSSGPSTIGPGVIIDWATTGGSGATSGFVVGDTYTFATTGPAYTSTDIVNVCQNIGSVATNWEWIHFVGRPSSISSAAAIAGILNTQMAAWFAIQRYSFAVMETPVDTNAINIDAALITGFSAVASDYVSVGAGDCNIVSAVTGSSVQRNAAWAATIRGSQVSVGTDLKALNLPNLAFVTNILRNEAVTPGLDAVGFTTLRTWSQYTGFYLTNANIMSSSNSQIKLWPHRRLLNLVCRLAYRALASYIGTPLACVASTGALTALQASAIQSNVSRVVAAQTVQQGQCQAIAITVNQTNNVLQTNTVYVTVGVQPFGYPSTINATIGFISPALSGV